MTFSPLRIPNYRFAGLAHRPRKILLFVNPFGGKKKGLKIWEKDVQPLMTIAGIDTKMLVTERVGHARDTLLSVDLSDFHASFILCFVGVFAASFIFGKFLLYRLLPIFSSSRCSAALRISFISDLPH